MRVRTALALLLILPFVLVACVEFEQTLTLNKDGSGTLQVRLAVEKTTLERLKAQLPGLGEEGENDPFDIERVKESFKALEGVRLASIEKIDDERQLGMQAVLAFESIAALQKGMQTLVAKNEEQAGHMEVYFVKGKEGRVRLVVYPSGRAEYERAQAQLAAIEKMSEEEQARQEDMFRMMRGGMSMDSLKLVHRIKVPGGIHAVQLMQKAAPDTAEFKVKGADIKSMADMTRISGQRFEVEFDGTECTMPLLEKEPFEEKRANEDKPVPVKRK